MYIKSLCEYYIHAWYTFVISRSIVFTIYSNLSDCGGSLNNNGGIASDDLEVSIRFSSNPSEWIPLAVIEISNQIVSTRRHGYDIPYKYILNINSNILKSMVTLPFVTLHSLTPFNFVG